MNNLITFALNLISRNPNVANNPNASEMINAIRNGDATKGEQIANNILKTYGISKEQGIETAKGFFNL